MYLISACLVGINCKYNGGNNYNEKALNLVKSGKAIPICPEQLGGLSTPRIPSEIKNIDGKTCVINKEGINVTEQFQRGAKEVLKIVQNLNINKVILKSKSPSCGIGKVYSGNFDGELVEGNGVTAQLLKDNGIEIFDIEEIGDEI